MYEYLCIYGTGIYFFILKKIFNKNSAVGAETSTGS